MFLLKFHVKCFMHGLWKECRKSNHHFSRLRRIEQCDYFLIHVCPYAWNNMDASRQFVVKNNIWLHLDTLSRKLKDLYNLTNIPLTLPKSLFVFITICRQIYMKCCQANFVQGVKKDVLCSIYVDSITVYEIM